MAALMSRAASALLPPLDGEPVDMLLPAYIAVAVLLVRVASERAVVPRLAAALKLRQRGGAAKHRRQAANIFNNSFIALSSGALTAWAWHVTLVDNGGCTPLNTKPCLAGWPDIEVSRQFKLVWLSIFGYYAYEMLGTALRVGGVALGAEMIVHHVITMVMMLYGYFYGLGRYGLMATALLDTSNALLHGAKALNYATPAVPELSGLKDAAFKAFALTFFTCRVLMPPFALIRPGLLDGRAMPLRSFVITNALLLFIYSLQLFWFAKIVRIALGQENGEDEDGGGGKERAGHAAAGGGAARVKAA